MKVDDKRYYSVKQYGGTTDKIIFVFGGWGFPAVVYRPLIRDLTRKGYHCVVYVPRKRLISVGTPYAEIVTAVRLAMEDAGKRMDTYSGKNVNLSSLGVSLGTLFATEFAKTHPEVAKLILIAPFGDFSEHVELWPSHRKFSKILASQPTSRKDSGEVLNQVGIYSSIEKLQGKEIFIGYSTNDVNIHTAVIERLVQLIVNVCPKTQVCVVKGRHLTGIVRQLYMGKDYADFLDNP